MKETEILIQAVEQATKNGLNLAQWQHPKISVGDKLYKYRVISTMPPYLSLMWTHDQYAAFDATESYEVKLTINDIIFSHDFAKAFFGEGVMHEFSTISNLCVKCDLDAAEWGGSLCEEGWQYHLQQMVISEDPLQYLAQFLTDKKEGDTG